MAPRPGGLGRPVSLADLLARGKPESDLEFFLARDPVVNPKSRTPDAPRLPSAGRSLGRYRGRTRMKPIASLAMGRA